MDLSTILIFVIVVVVVYVIYRIIDKKMGP